MNSMDFNTKKKIRNKIQKIKEARNDSKLPPLESIYPIKSFRKTVNIEPRTDTLTREYFYNKKEDVKEGSQTVRDPHKRPKNSVLIIVKFHTLTIFRMNYGRNILNNLLRIQLKSVKCCLTLTSLFFLRNSRLLNRG